MTNFKDIYDIIYSFDSSVYAGIAVVSTAVVSAGLVFYLGKKYCLKDSEKDKGKDLEKKLEE